MDKRKKSAFSLAELMITLLILSIVLSAVMPAVTKRNAGQEGVWRWLYDGSHAYFGTGPNQEALIGMAVKPKLGITEAIPDYAPIDINGVALSGTEAQRYTTTDSGDRLLIMKYTYQYKGDGSSYTAHPMSNSHITFFSSSYNASGSNEQVHYAGRLSLDETNIALGKHTMANLTHVSTTDSEKDKKNNLAIGQFALFALTTGYENVALGNGALYSNGTGHRNVAVGYQSLLWNESGHENNAFGYQALFNNHSGVGNNAVGHQAGFGLAKGNYNTVVGSFSLKAGPASVDAEDMEGSGNAVLGYGALNKGANADNNTAIGMLSGNSTVTGENNLFAGAWSGFTNISGANNTMLGFFSGFSNTTAAYNTYVGSQAGYSNSSGEHAVFVGADAGYSNTTADDNIYIGYQAGFSNTEGADNTFLGYQAGYSNTTGGKNVFIGYKAGFSNTDSSNQFILSNGYELLKGQFPAEDGDEGSTFETLAYTTDIGSRMTNIGKNSSGDPTITVNSSDGIIAFGGKLTTAGGGTNPLEIIADINMGNNNISGINKVTTNRIWAATYENLPAPAAPSDKRLKNITGDAKKGLSTVDSFKIVKFNYKNDETKTEHVGVIAQDLQKILPSAVVKGHDGFLSVTFNDVIFTIAKAVQELHQAVLDLAKEVKTIAAKVTSNTQKIEALEKENAALKQQINDLDARLKKLEEAK